MRSGPERSPAEETLAGLLDGLRGLRVHTKNGVPSRHKPLALAWAISRVSAGKPRLAPWREFREEVGGLLEEFRTPGSSVTPQYPFWHLGTSDIWDVRGLPAGQDTAPGVAMLEKLDPEAGLSQEAARLLGDASARLKAIAVLREHHFTGIDQQALLTRLGLADYTTASGTTDPADGDGAAGPAARRESTHSRVIRDSALTLKVKSLHENRCQACGLRLPTPRGDYSEAAHIRGLGRPHHGPDVLSNLLVLCPNHHTQFDLLGLYVDTDDTVRLTMDDSEVGVLRRHPDHRIDPRHLARHRTLCGKDTPDRKAAERITGNPLPDASSDARREPAHPHRHAPDPARQAPAERRGPPAAID
ncbi:HNH endonuclease [Streptomyces sp. NPDC088557]|uniref:HNH endonuclease n=1 Tax=Streptomyces sp. NPDC088557 TaxID=3365867 RepID=UPI00381F7764